MSEQEKARIRLAIEHLQLAESQLHAINWRDLMQGEDDLRLRAIDAIRGAEDMAKGMTQIRR